LGADRLGETFVRLCEIPSPSGSETRVADYVATELRRLGLEVTEDDTAGETGAGCGNLVARIPGPPGARTVMLCAHLDTVPVADRIEVVLRDYRHETGRYDAVASVEMIEAVGERFWPTYFSALDTLLTPGGRVALQAITMPHDRMVATRDSYTWIHKYVFPGGIIPSMRAVAENLETHTRLSIVERRDLGPHYAHTLNLWRQRFLANWGRLEGSFDETFRRMWEFYLAYCEAGFRVGYLNVSQLGLARAPF
jgi:cyclopropane-fatty-acyl-phospholipid synthase